MNPKYRFLIRIVSHLFLWCISYFILFRVFTIQYQNGASDHIYTLLFHIPILACVYMNQWVISKWFVHRQFLPYTIGVLIILTLCTALHFLVFNHFADILFPGFYFISYYSITEVLQFLVSYLVITSLLTMTSDWFKVKENQLQLEKENRKIQLENLKNQINPHFLFNSLNNISAITTEDPKSTRKHLIKLADSLRYVLYETNEDKVPLQQEIDYVENFIALENLRLEAPHQVSLVLVGDPSPFLIAPLLLLPLIENTYKHSDRKKPEIKIKLSISSNGLLELSSSNKIDLHSVSKEEGIGLTNLEQRLKIIYGEKSTLNLDNRDQYFFADLVIDLNAGY